MSGTMEVSDGGTSFLGSLWQMVKRHFQRSTITGTHLLDLNDDCLIELMSFLTDEDLCSVVESSTDSSIRLKDIATKAFRRSWRSRKITNSNKMIVNKIHERRVFEFEHFRSVILANVLTCANLTELNIHCFDQNVTQFIHDLSSLTSLTILRLHSIRCDPEFLQALAKLKQLLHLSLEDCEVNDLSPLAAMDHLEVLYILPYSSNKLDFEVVQLVKHLRNLWLLIVEGNFRLDKKTYLSLRDVVLKKAKARLYLACAIHKDVADAQNEEMLLPVKRHFQRSTITGTHLLDLNDDCLIELMSFLTDEDLCSVVESSTDSSIRLKDIATKAFRRSWRSRKITNSNKMIVNKIHERRVFEFEHFRSVILANVLTCANLTELNIHCFDQNVTQFIHDLSSLTSLTILRLHSIRCDPEFLQALAKLKQLLHLSLEDCEVNDLSPLAAMDHLEVLYILPYSSNKLDFEVVQLVKHLRNLWLLIVEGNFRLDKKTYLSLRDVVLKKAKARLYLACAIHKDVADAQNEEMLLPVRIFDLSERCSWNEKLKRFCINFVHSLIDVLDDLGGIRE